MTAPERIWTHQTDDVYLMALPHKTDGTEYIRADLLDAHIGAVLAEAAEHVRMQLWRHGGEDGYSAGMDAGARHQNEVDAAAILALRPTALTALDRAKREAYREGWAFAFRQWEATGSVPPLIAAEKEGKP